jgi:hypothetical protein
MVWVPLPLSSWLYSASPSLNWWNAPLPLLHHAQDAGVDVLGDGLGLVLGGGLGLVLGDVLGLLLGLEVGLVVGVLLGEAVGLGEGNGSPCQAMPYDPAGHVGT